MNMNELNEATEQVKDAHRKQRQILEQMYPVGTEWKVMLSSAQKRPSIMMVISHETGCTPCVRFARERTVNRWGKVWKDSFRKTVCVTSIVGPASYE